MSCCSTSPIAAIGYCREGSTSVAPLPGDGFLHSQGFIMVAGGWQGDVLPGSGRLTMTVPVANYAGGGTIVGRVRTEYGLPAGPATTQNLGSGPYTGTTTASYETVTLNNLGSVLTQRVHQD